MILPEQVQQAISWGLVLGLAYFSADSTAALLERRLQVPPKPIPTAYVPAAREDVPAQAVPPALVALLETTKPEEAEAEAGAVSADGSPTVRPSGQAGQKPAEPKNLRLKGTMAGAGGTGLAMLELNNEVVVVSAGEEIAGYTLALVEPYSIRLEASGQSIVLEMDVATDVAPPSVQASARRPNEPIVPSEEETEEEADGEAPAILTQRELRNILDNPTEFAGQGFRMNPVLREGDIVGMKVSIPSSSHPLARLGVQNGDVVRSLNGTPITGPESLTAIYRILRNTSNLRFEVEREGQDQTISVELAE